MPGARMLRHRKKKKQSTAGMKSLAITTRAKAERKNDQRDRRSSEFTGSRSKHSSPNLGLRPIAFESESVKNTAAHKKQTQREKKSVRWRRKWERGIWFEVGVLDWWWKAKRCYAFCLQGVRKGEWEKERVWVTCRQPASKRVGSPTSTTSYASKLLVLCYSPLSSLASSLKSYFHSFIAYSTIMHSHKYDYVWL